MLPLLLLLFFLPFPLLLLLHVGLSVSGCRSTDDECVGKGVGECVGEDVGFFVDLFELLGVLSPDPAGGAVNVVGLKVGGSITSKGALVGELDPLGDLVPTIGHTSGCGGVSSP